jgi:hypothetical protein
MHYTKILLVWVGESDRYPAGIKMKFSTLTVSEKTSFQEPQNGASAMRENNAHLCKESLTYVRLSLHSFMQF